jgi:choline kinase
LARKRIGPRLLGTFENGRFEEFFDAKTLTKEDLRVPEISRHIAKRLKELHESIELEDWERRVGPISWCSWYKWLPRTREIMAIMDSRGNPGKNGYVCGCRWDKFETAVERYRGWVCARYGGEDNMMKQMIFTHNDVSSQLPLTWRRFTGQADMI